MKLLVNNRDIQVSYLHGVVTVHWSEQLLRVTLLGFPLRLISRFDFFARLLRLNRVTARCSPCRQYVVITGFGLIRAVRLCNEPSFRAYRLSNSKYAMSSAICFNGDDCYIGEYGINRNSKPIPVHHIAFGEVIQHYVISIQLTARARHIHQIVCSSKESREILITTGDSSEESIILRYNTHTGESTLIGRGQVFRTLSLTEWGDVLRWGTDSDLMDNYFVTMDEGLGAPLLMARVPNPIWYVLRMGRMHFFTTTVERYYGSQSKYAELYCTEDFKVFRSIYKSKKDVLPKTLFQFGVLEFSWDADSIDDVYINHTALVNKDPIKLVELVH